MIPSIATVTLGGELPQRLAAAARAGFQMVELFDTDLEACGEHPGAVKKLVSDAGLKTASLFPLREVEGVPLDQRQATRDRAAAYLDLAAELGAPMVMMCSATSEQLSGERELIVEDLNWLADSARDRGLRLAYEALSWGRYIYDYRDAASLVAQINHTHFGLVLDSFHIFARRHPIDEITSIPAEQLFLVQVSDAPELEINYIDWSRNHRVLPGQGAFDLLSFTRKVQSTGYNGIFSLECFNNDLRSGDPITIAGEGCSALDKLWAR